MKCKYCDNIISGNTNKVFCSAKCRLSAFRSKTKELDESVSKSVSKSVSNETEIPQNETVRETVPGETNWIKWAPIIKHLFEDKDKILKYGTSGEAIFYLGQYRIRLS